MLSARVLNRLVGVVACVLAIALLGSCQLAQPSSPAASPTASAASTGSSAGAPTSAPASVTPAPKATSVTQPTVGASVTAASGDSTATPTSRDRNVAPKAKLTVSAGADSAAKAIDGDPKTFWSAGAAAPQTITLALDQPYLVDDLQLVVAQKPDGQTTQEIWLGDPNGSLQLYRKMVNVWTANGQTINIPIQPARVIDRVMIRTDSSPSFVAWSEIRVTGQPPGAGTTAGAPGKEATPVVVQWPKIAVVGNFDQPTQVTNAGDGSGRLFVSDRRGVVWIVKDGIPLAKPFLDISDKVKCCEDEQGFFDIAFPPGFAQKQYFYVSYTSKTRGPVGDTIFARYQVTSDPNVADPDSEQIILEIPKKTGAHNGGSMEFGPKDGYLYIGVGDGGVQNDPTNEAQNPDSLQGKILRIDTESGAFPYAIPPTNPFVDQPGHRPEVWDLGLRNPWRIAFDKKTGDLYIADVGENNYEEIDYQPASSHGGLNFGWHIMEGDHCHLTANCDERGLTLPVAEYTHKEGCAVIGGQVYRGEAYPDMDGVFFYADLCSGKIWGLRRVGAGWETNLLATEPFSITDIGADEQGNLYLTDFSDGAVFRITEPDSAAG